MLCPAHARKCFSVLPLSGNLLFGSDVKSNDDHVKVLKLKTCKRYHKLQSENNLYSEVFNCHLQPECLIDRAILAPSSHIELFLEKYCCVLQLHKEIDIKK